MPRTRLEFIADYLADVDPMTLAISVVQQIEMARASELTDDEALLVGHAVVIAYATVCRGALEFADILTEPETGEPS